MHKSSINPALFLFIFLLFRVTAATFGFDFGNFADPTGFLKNFENSDPTGFLKNFANVGGQQGIRTGFYDQSCPSFEKIVRDTVTQAAGFNPGIIPGLLRLHFHDCFVRGCDASVLLDSAPTLQPVEKASGANGLTLRGLEVIDTIKETVEISCPLTVSCADILAFAAREAVVLAGIPHYDLPGGRKDGLISLASEVGQNLPGPGLNVTSLTAKFAARGFTQEEMVVLSGAHSIGRAHCVNFNHRLYNFAPNQAQDPTLDAAFAEQLKAMCPPQTMLGQPGAPVSLNAVSGGKNSLDGMYYQALKQGKGLLNSDQVLMSNPETRALVEKFAKDPNAWKEAFAKAMVKVSSVVDESATGQVRAFCRFVNVPGFNFGFGFLKAGQT